MDGTEYLKQISAQQRPVKPAKPSIFQSKFFMIGAIGVGLLILIMIIGAFLGGGENDKDRTFALKLHLDGTEEMIKTYQPHIKSSFLRSSSSSLHSVLTDANAKLTTYVEEKYKYKEKSVEKKILEAAQADKEELNSSLFEAKINGNLDRIYAHKMAYEISLFMNEMADVVNKTKDAGLKSALTSSYESLETIYNNFNDFSESK